MNEVIEKENIKIENMIYEIRGVQVMFDSDLAKLYETETKRINESVRRNTKRFPFNFCFQVTYEELEKCTRSQIATLYKNGHQRGNNIKYLPYVFTEQGVAMLSSVLHTKTAINTSIQIINAFVEMRRYISTSLMEQKYINDLVFKNSKRIDLIEDTLSNFKEKIIIYFLRDKYMMLIQLC